MIIMKQFDIDKSIEHISCSIRHCSMIHCALKSAIHSFFQVDWAVNCEHVFISNVLDF